LEDFSFSAFQLFSVFLRILHVIPSLSAKHGGPSVALPLMARSLVRLGVRVDVATTDDDGPGYRAGVPLNEPVQRDGWNTYFFHKQTEFYKYSRPLSCWLKEHVRNYDVVHIHALFSYSSTCAARHARHAGVPYVVRPLGVLNQWGRENRRRYLKALSMRFVEGPILKHAAAMHYTSASERREAEQAGVRAHAIIIPIGIDMEPFQTPPDAELFLRRFPEARGKQLVLFLSRLDPKKGLDLLLPAFAEFHREHPDTLLVLAGTGEPDFLKSLHVMARQLGIANSIIWTGFVTGADKLAAFAASSVFVLPSYSENFGIALVEAMAAGLACVSTEGVAVSEDVRSKSAGIVAGTNASSVAQAIDRLLSDSKLREQCAGNARALVRERYSLDGMGAALQQLYGSMARGTPVG
jgi:glycosyltransferase involved in cell wall biosynthesis